MNIDEDVSRVVFRMFYFGCICPLGIYILPKYMKIQKYIFYFLLFPIFLINSNLVDICFAYKLYEYVIEYIVYRKINIDEICSICLFPNCEIITICNHCFHKNCILQWSINNLTCPMCRRVLNS